MLLGGRPIGSRTVADATGFANFNVVAAVVVTGAVSFDGVGDLSVASTTFLQVSFDGVGDLAVAGASVVMWARIEFVGRGDMSVVIPSRGRERRYVVTDVDGNPIDTLTEGVTAGDVTWEVNAPDAWEFAMPRHHQKADVVHGTDSGLPEPERLREVQLWRGDRLLTWGPMIRPTQEGPAGNLQVSGAGADWYFFRRHIGKANRTNYVLNGNFEEGLAYWDLSYAVLEPQANLTWANISAQVVTDRAVSGARSLKMTQANPAIPELNFMVQQHFIWTVDPAENPDGEQWTLAARCYIPSASWVGPAAENLGINLLRASTSETTTVTRPGGSPQVYPKNIEMRIATITEDTPRDTWVTIVTDLQAPVTGAPEFVTVELWCPDGVIYWDRVMLARKERLAFFGVDQALIVKGIGEHLQDSLYEKSDLNIGFDCQPTGVLRDRIYLHEEHPPGGRSMHEFNELFDGLDIGMRYTPTERTLFTAYPAEGRRRYDVDLLWGVNVVAYSWGFDGEAAANQIIIMGEGVGSTREEGFAETYSPYADLKTLERVESAPLETPIDSLDDRAEEVLMVSRNPEIITVVCPPGTDLIDRLGKGDSCHLGIVDGGLVVDEVYRAVRITLKPDDSLEITLNRRSHEDRFLP